MKKSGRRRPQHTAKTPRNLPERPWMSNLALMAAASKTDGGAGLQFLLHSAKFDERPQLSLTKRAAA